MQNKIIPSMLTAALLSVSSIALAGGPEIFPEPDYFSGFYVGGFGGVEHATFNGNSSITLQEPITIFNIFPIVQEGNLQSNSFNGGNFQGVGGVQGGFGMEINHMFYAGVQGWGWWGSASHSETTSAFAPIAPVTIGAVTINNFANASSTTTAKIKDNAGVAAKLGWVVAPGSMIYGKIGASWAQLRVSESTSSSNGRNIIVNGTTVFSHVVTTESDSNNEKTKPGLATSVGFEQFVYQDVASINVEAGYTNFGHVNTSGQVTGNSSTAFPTIIAIPFSHNFTTNIVSSATTNAKVTTLLAGINFYFGRGAFGI